MTVTPQMEILGTALFAAAVLHTFLVKRFQHLARKFPEGSVGENLFHLLGEVEVVFGVWAAIFAIAVVFVHGPKEAVTYLESRDFKEPLFVFAIMTVAATRPVIELAAACIGAVARILPLPRETAFLLSALTVGPLLGSFITEPAAMTVTALILKDRFFDRQVPQRFRYAVLGTLFVNVSIGGVLTPYAAPPVLMVAGTWAWDLSHMLRHFGWKAAVATVASASTVAFSFAPLLRGLRPTASRAGASRSPSWLMAIHVVFLGIIVFSAHHPVVFIGALLFFLGVLTITQEYQDGPKLKESLLVAFFLGGLVVFGGLQRWWLEPLLSGFSPGALFVGATGLTAVTDNAALTYLGAQIPGITDALKYALVAGAIAGGGLTVIANAPNPAGFAILRESFGKEGISPVGLFLAALPATLIGMACLWLLPSL